MSTRDDYDEVNSSEKITLLNDSIDQNDESRIDFVTPPKHNDFGERITHFFLMLGPGLAVMLANTDAGSLIIASQSGAQWGYSLIPLNIILIPVVFAAQELTVRLAIYTKKGQAELIKEHYGKIWAWFVTIIILVTCTGAITTEISGIIGVGQIFGLSNWVSILLMDSFLILVVLTGSYTRVEKIAVCIGLFELVFLVTMIMALPSPEKFVSGIGFKITNPSFLNLVSANIGAVIMPWMIFYQQSALVERALEKKDLKMERIETGISACLTQLVMVAGIMTTAGTIWDGSLPSVSVISEVPDISNAIIPHLGQIAGRVLFSLGMIGGAMIGAIMATITASWTLGEVVGFGRALDKSPLEAPGFLVLYLFILAVATTVCVTLQDYLVKISIAVETMNAVLLPVVLVFTFLLSYNHLPIGIHLQGPYAFLLGIVFFIVSAFGVYSAIYSLAI